MKAILKFTACILITWIVVFVSCKKEFSCEGCIDSNKPPIAIAGGDQIITLPKDSVTLDGSASTDPDGTITSYKWSKISGPLSSSITKADSSKTLVKSLVTGVYEFELTVTDNGGLSAKDTMRMIVNDSAQPNRPPVANAGANQSITLPANTVTLDGSASTDPDNNITGYVWTKISGPSSFNIVNANAVQTQVINLLQGIYQFELKVTDNGGLSAKDTINITVYPLGSSCNISFESIGPLSISRGAVCTATVGDKILFAGGHTLTGTSLPFIPSSRVDIYNTTTQNWSTAELSTPRVILHKAVTVGNKIFFGGDGESTSSRFDIYDASTNGWSTVAMSLSVPREGYAMSSANGKIVFAGGHYPFGTVVDIYDVASNTWSTNNLNKPRLLMSPASIGNKIYFSGGFDVYYGGGHTETVSNEVDIYDASTNGWSVIYMTVPRTHHGSISADNKLFWFGGDSWDSNDDPVAVDTTEIYDINTGSRQYHRPTGDFSATKNNKVLFFKCQYWLIAQVEIYNLDTQTWSHCEIINPILASYRSAVTVGNNIYILRDSQVLKLIF